MQVEQIDRDAANRFMREYHMDLADTKNLAEDFARHRIAERERVVGEIAAYLKAHKGFGAGWFGADVEHKFGESHA